MALSSCPIAFSNKSNVFTNTRTDGWPYIAARMCRRVHTDMSGSPQWIAFTRPTTTDIPTFIHRLYASLRVYLHIHVVKEHIYICIYTSVPRHRRFDQIYVSTAGVHSILKPLILRSELISAGPPVFPLLATRQQRTMFLTWFIAFRRS